MQVRQQGDVFFCYALSCFDHCPEKRDESNPHTIGIGWLPFGLEPFGPELKAEGLRAERQFIPFFGTLQCLLLKGHMAKKDISLFSQCFFLLRITLKRSS